MKYTSLLVRLAQRTAMFALASMVLVDVAVAQSVPTATQQLQLSAFAAGTGTFTDLEGGKNLAITAGADLTWLNFRLFKPAVEFRGTYPIDSGHISNQKSFLVGPRVEYPIGRMHPYVDFLFGRGAINYLDGGFIVGCCTEYLSSNSFIYSPGIGIDYDLSHHFAVKADVQFQHWNTPVTASGSINPTAVSIGGVYNFDFNPRHQH